MNKIKILFLITALMLSTCYCSKENASVNFDFNKTRLTDVLKFISEKKGVSIIYPVNPSQLDKINKQTITYNSNDLSLNDAWDLLLYFLSFAGLSLTKKTDNTYILETISKKDTAGIWQEDLPIYVNSDIETLNQINAKQPIRYIYHFRQLADIPEINNLINYLKTPNSPANVELKEQKGIMITDFANNIASLINIINTLDNKEVRQSVAVVPIIHISSEYISDLFSTLKAAVGPSESKVAEIGNFVSNTTVIPHQRTNSIILIGSESSIEKISTFIRDRFDQPIGEGSSILHIYDVQCLEAPQLASIIQNFINGTQNDDEAQSSEVKSDWRNKFEGTIVNAQSIEQLNEASLETNIQDILVNIPYIGVGIEGAIAIGGNRILVAALDDKWLQIKELIKKIDSPEPAVILDVVMLDITRDTNKEISGTTRNFTPLNLTGKNGFQFLSSQISNPGVVLGGSPSQLAIDLLSNVGGNNMDQLAPSGSFIMSFNDPNTPGIWGLITAIDKIAKVKIINHPFLVATNNKLAIIEQSDVRRGPGELLQEEAGVFVIPTVNIKADFTIKMVPHLSRNLDRLRLDIEIIVDNFIGSTLNRQNRDMQTTVSLASGQIFALGGFTREENLEIDTFTPILGNIPFIQNFFRGTTLQTLKNDIIILIMPTVVHPKNPEKAENYTYDKVNDLRVDYYNNRIISNPKDPVSRLFFEESLDVNDSIFQTSGIVPKKPK